MPAAYGESRKRTWAAIAASVSGLYAVALGAVVVFYVAELVQGAGSDPVRVITSSVLIAMFAVGLSVLCLGWAKGMGWVRTPTIVWCLLLLPVTVSLLQAGQAILAVGVGGSGLLGLVAAIRGGADE
ncbi:MAG: hypothetical protein ACK5MP_00820 [Nostocoides sp.]